MKINTTRSVSNGFELDRDDSIPGLLKELDAFIHNPDEHERVMAVFDQQHFKKYSETTTATAKVEAI